VATVFTQTTVVTVDPGQTVLHDAALAVENDRIVALGPTPAVLQAYPAADIYDGRGKALLPGLINCHAHLTATLNRGITEDFGFPPALHLPVPVQGLLSSEAVTVMALLGTLESLRSGTTTLVENAAGIGVYAEHLAQTGLRWVLAETGATRTCRRVGALARTSGLSPRPYGRKRCNAFTTCSANGTARETDG
jgi:5-methylthioadenosine/S-adenosylhomocysteine deaminase